MPDKKKGGGGSPSGGTPDPNEHPHGGIGGGPSEREQMIRWIQGKISWNQLSNRDKEYLRKHVREYAVNNPGKFNISPSQAAQGAFWNQITEQDLVHAINEGSSPTPGHGNDPPPGHDTGGSGNHNQGPGGNNQNNNQNNNQKGNQKAPGGPKRSGELPGVKGKDYSFVKSGGKIYVVYTVRFAAGTQGAREVKLGWGVSPEMQKRLGISAKDTRNLTAAQKKQLNFFGDARDITLNTKNIHPFNDFLGNLRDAHPGASWLGDKEYMQVLIMGYAEGWSQTMIQERLAATDWAQNRTVAEQAWEKMGKAEKSSVVDNLVPRMQDILTQIYGSAAGKMPGNVAEAAKAIASGAWGSPDDALIAWELSMRRKAENIVGTNAWVEKEQSAQAAREFMNGPEDMYEALRSKALTWLGPTGMMDSGTLMRWAEDVFSERKSDADFDQYLRNQAHNLYPYLGANEPWMDRAASYKKIAEDAWGAPIDWSDNILKKLGQGGQPLSYDDFSQKVRSTDEFWAGPVAREEGFNLIAQLNQTFKGIR